MIALDDLMEICPDTKRSKLEVMVGPLNSAMDEFSISSFARETAFIAQCAHESGGFVWLKELWGPTPAQTRYEPPSLKAKELGNTEPGDGLRFRGRGILQTTGRANYRDAGTALGLDLENHPTLLEEPVNACRAAAYFWKTHGLNEVADSGDFKRATKIVNGGYNGLAERLAYYERAKQVLA